MVGVLYASADSEVVLLTVANARAQHVHVECLYIILYSLVRIICNVKQILSS